MRLIKSSDEDVKDSFRFSSTSLEMASITAEAFYCFLSEILIGGTRMGTVA